MLVHELAEPPQEGVADGSDDHAVGVKVDAFVEQDLVTQDPYVFCIRATVFIGVAVSNLGFVRAGVGFVEDAVLIGVQLRATILVGETIHVLALEGARVRGIQHAVEVVVGLRAAIRVLEAIDILGFQRALIRGVE
jgi:hypothetical protein